MNFLIDHNIEGYARILLSSIASQGWLELISINFISFKDIDLSTSSSDRIVWCVAQENKMILLTANRNMDGEDSLEQVLREENSLDSLPIITIGSVERLNEPNYRERCVDRILEIVLDIENVIGVGRLYIP